MKTGSRSVSILGKAVALSLLAVSLLPASSEAALRPGAYESLAAQAPIIMVGRIEKIGSGSGRLVAVFRVIQVGRGNLKQESLIKVEIDRKPTGKKRMGPKIKYHKMARGQTWLLFLTPPTKKKTPYHTLAAYGWYTQRLDGITTAKGLLALLPQATHKDMEASLGFLREVYQGVGWWLEEEAKAQK